MGIKIGEFRIQMMALCLNSRKVGLGFEYENTYPSEKKKS